MHINEKIKLNWHIYEQCNMSCKYCFRKKDSNLKQDFDYKSIIDKLCDFNYINEINIAGGEPTLNKPLLLNILDYCKSKNIKTSIITNCFNILTDMNYLNKILEYVGTFGISIDSLDKQKNKLIGRSVNNKTITYKDLEKICKIVNLKNIKLKINIVASSANLFDDSLKQLKNLKIDRLKILRNQSTKKANFPIKLNEFKDWVNWFKDNCLPTNTKLVVEEEMNNAYLMLTSNGFISINNNDYYSIFDKEQKQDINKIINKLLESNLYKDRYQ